MSEAIDELTAAKLQVEALATQLAEVMTALLIALGKEKVEPLPSLAQLLEEVVNLRVANAQMRAQALVSEQRERGADTMAKFRRGAPIFNRPPDGKKGT